MNTIACYYCNAIYKYIGLFRKCENCSSRNIIVCNTDNFVLIQLLQYKCSFLVSLKQDKVNFNCWNQGMINTLSRVFSFTEFKLTPQNAETKLKLILTYM